MRARWQGLIAGCALLAGAVWLWQPPAASGDAAQAVAGWIAEWSSSVGWQGFDALHRIAVAGFAASPEATLGLAAALALPVIGIVASLCRWLGRLRRSRRALALVPPAQLEEPGSPRLAGKSTPCAEAWLVIQSREGAQDRLIGGEICRIGSGADNDIMLANMQLAAAHALIRRTPEAEFVIIDVSGEAGTGLSINGRRVRRCPLADGDRIELGEAAVIFHRAQAVSHHRLQRATRTLH